MKAFRHSGDLSTNLPNLSSSTGKWSSTTTMRDADASRISFPGKAATRNSDESCCSCCRANASPPQQEKKKKIRKPIISTPARPVPEEEEEDVHHSRGSNRRSLFGSIRHLYVEKSQSLLLENTASVARDHLANERTFLAWLRTSLTLVTVGVAITQLYHLAPGDTRGINHQRLGRVVGALFVSFSMLFLYFGNARYFHSQASMTKGYFPASRGSVAFASTTI
ncbi:hypothetical protein BCR43DRAFT_461651, partial [Syncephalastrum racemosum]